jgi:hypothetical protein
VRLFHKAYIEKVNAIEWMQNYKYEKLNCKKKNQQTYFELKSELLNIVNILESYFDYTNKKALEVINEYKYICLELCKSRNEFNIAKRLSESFKESISGEKWLNHIIKAKKDILKREEDNIYPLSENDLQIKINNNKLLIYEDLDFYERYIINELRIMYKHSLKKSLFILNKYIDGILLFRFNIPNIEQYVGFINESFKKGISNKDFIKNVEESSLI